ncbi:MAG: ribosome recycling factor [Deltaproteobacteria bacterium]|nr:ribosome recycling factor [Deltaproteobacteria bacterium]
MQDEVISTLKEQGEEATSALQKALARIRTGRANLSMLDSVRVEYYGSKSPLNQMATLTVVDPRLITIKPFDRSTLGEIERVLRATSDLGISPQNDGEKIMLPIPPLTEERRREFTKVAKAKGEEAKISIRNARRDANEMLKELEKAGELPEDDAKRAQAEVQKITDEYVKIFEDTVAKKEKEIMEV